MTAAMAVALLGHLLIKHYSDLPEDSFGLCWLRGCSVAVEMLNQYLCGERVHYVVNSQICTPGT